MERRIKTLEGKFLASFVSIFALFMFSALIAGVMGKQYGLQGIFL
jgi:hypothetical protein